MTSDFNDTAARRYINTSQQPASPGRQSASPRVLQSEVGAPVPARVRVINWHDLDAADARVRWRRLDRWVNQVHADYGLAPNIIPPFWHRHPELVWAARVDGSSKLLGVVNGPRRNWPTFRPSSTHPPS